MRLVPPILSPALSATGDLEDDVSRRSRYASIGLVVLMLGVSSFAVWSSLATDRAANRAIEASRLSDDYSAAAGAVAGEESLERKYRLEPGPDVRERYDQTSADFTAALDDVRGDGDGVDADRVDEILAQHGRYLDAIILLFAATDRGDDGAAIRIDQKDVDPAFETMQTAVLAASDAQHQESLTQLRSLGRLEVFTSRLTPLVFLLGLVLAVLLTGVARGHRRLLAQERSKAVHEALHDTLTGLPNRKLLADRFAQALHDDVRSGTHTGLLLIDLDRFKEINDTFGHHYGDDLLAQVGPRLSEGLRAGDTVARLGGDEFAVLLPNLSCVEDATTLAGTLRSALESSFRVLNVELDVEASIGVVLSGTHGEDPTALLQRADIAMYAAKTTKRGVAVYDAEADEHTPERLALLGDLRRALENDELTLHFQPQVSVDDARVVGVEALVRWQHPERGLVYPDDFIPMAEHTGLIGALTRHVLDAALGQVRRWCDAGRPLRVSVNLSARNLLDDGLGDTVAALLAEHGVPTHLLQLEVTESSLMTEPARAQQVLEQLNVMGIRISIDDFGAGYTSLAQLKTLPVSELKIDKSFVMTMTEDSSNDLIVHSVIELGHNLGLSIVAEGVEDEGTLTALRGHGCDTGQGYHLTRPIPAAALELWLDARHEGLRPGVAQPARGEQPALL